MKKLSNLLLLLILIALTHSSASAGELRAFVADFTVAAQQPPDFQATLRRLISSRIAGDGIRTVDSASEADVIVSGSFTQFGKMFSLDAVARTPQGRVLATGFEQGASPDDLIPALGKVSNRLKAEIAKASVEVSGEPAKVDGQAKGDRQAPLSEIVRSGAAAEPSDPIAGTESSLAPGRELAGDREVVVGDANLIRYYRRGAGLSLLCQLKLPLRQKLIGLDAGGTTPDGAPLIYATIIDDEIPASNIYVQKDGELKTVAEKLPYLFRSIALNGGKSRIYAQRMGHVDDFEGDLFEASFENGTLALKNPIKLPRFANVFNFNSFRDRSGKTFLTALSDGGFLTVYSDKGEELWKSSDKFGGSETSFQLTDRSNRRNSWTLYRTRFIEQRITVTERGDIIVPQNGGFFSSDNARSYSKSSLVALRWNGSSLEERWRTKQSQNYLADYLYEPLSHELVLLEVVQRDGLFHQGKSALRTVRVQ